MLRQILSELHKQADPVRAKNLSRFFKTGIGEYGEGDKFLGLTVPIIRSIASQYKKAGLKVIGSLLHNEYHEIRLTALIILTLKFKKANEVEQKEYFNFYLKNTKYINNWDLVDLTAHKIIGNYLINRDRKIIYNLSRSKNLWEKRISIISTFAFIRDNEFDDTIKLSKILLNDKHDLVHKAVGWALREVGKKNQKIEEEFLIRHYKVMPRTMLRYSIEKFSKTKRNFYLKK